MATETHGDWDKLLEIFQRKGKSMLLPGIAATLGTGALSSYMTSREDERIGESSEERRARIIRNGLIASGLTGGTLLGGTALSALGEHSFKERSGPNINFPFVGKSPGNIMDYLSNAASESPVTTLVGSGVGYMSGKALQNKLLGKGIQQSVGDLAKDLGMTPNSLREAAQKGQLDELIAKWRQGNSGPDSLLRKGRRYLAGGGADLGTGKTFKDRIAGPDKAMRRFSQAHLSGKRRYILPILAALGLGATAGNVVDIGDEAVRNL